jgi:hypothetical protein
MNRLVCLLLVLAVLAVVGCKSTPRGDREFIPGKGWVPVE